VPGLAGAANQGQDLTGMLASSSAERATAVSGPVISITPASHNFGRVNDGTTTGSFVFTVSNTGDANLTLSATLIHSNPSGGFSAVVGPNWTLAIPPGGSRTLSTAYTPSGSGFQSDNITFSTNATNGSGNVLLSGTANNAPVFNPALASDYTAAAHVLFTLDATANDFEGDPLTWSIASVPALPVGATFNTATGHLEWTPVSADAGNYAVTITVTDGLASTPGSFTLHVTASNDPPTANPGGPYNGVTGQPLALNGSGSTDPNSGQTLTYSWNFGDGTSGSGPTPSHTYAAAGIYIVSLTVTDDGSPVLSDTKTTSATIVDFIPIQIVQAALALPIIKTSGNGYQKFGIECQSRALTDIDQTSIKISTTYPNAGTVSEVSVPGGGKKGTFKIGDINLNSFFDLDIQFRSSVIRPLLIHVPDGTVVTLVFTALTSGDHVLMRGTIDLTKSGPSGVSSAAAPNPFKPETNISYAVHDSGPVSIRIFSVNGQLVRSLREEYTTPGAYEVRWNGKDDAGRTAPSGIYFVSVKQGLESSTTRVVLAR
jgi:PKD repeat protein